jgi:hypothetical protein
MSGSMKNPAKPQTTVMMALMIKSHLKQKALAISHLSRNDRVTLPPPCDTVMTFQGAADSSLNSTRHHAANGLTRMIESHTFGQLQRGVPMH